MLKKGEKNNHIQQTKERFCQTQVSHLKMKKREQQIIYGHLAQPRGTGILK